ncbi:MAG: hypothetical protein MUP53_04880 [Bacteroidales bacterium]|nr:hypothetical protein [Bacteroidales bacterium]
MITIKRLELKKTYRIEWLRYITGVDLTQHCMKSFLGHNDPRIKGYGRGYYDINLKEGYQYYYFCAVHEDWIWKNNIHIAFREKTGSKIIIDNEKVKCEIENAEGIPITINAIDRNLPQASNELFYTCRNWMFANMIKNTFTSQNSLFNG